MSLNSEIILCSGIKMDKQYVNVLSYSESDMVSLCRQKAIASGNKYSFLRPTNSLYVDFSYAQCLQANYIAFQNKDYSNKWFFAWIDEVIFKGEKNCEIKYTVDAWSTWFSYWTKKPCFISRQHVNDDTIGLHTIQENLDVGEVIEIEEIEDSAYTNDFGFWVAICGNWQPDDNSHATASLVKEGKQFSGVSVFNKQVFGNQIFLFDISSISNLVNVGLFLQRTNRDGYISDVKDMFIVPNALIDITKLTEHTAYTTMTDDYPFTFYTSSFTSDITKFNTTINKVNSFDNVEIKNNKCFCFPYNYLFVSNNNGNNNIYKYEDFSSQNCVFENQLAMSIGVSGRLVPKNYKGMTVADDESLPLGKYPTCGWSADSYINWLTQNAINIPTQIATSFLPNLSNKKIKNDDNVEIEKTFVDVNTMPLNVANTIANEIGAFYSASLMPNIQGGGNTGNVIFGANKNCFTFRKMRLKDEYIAIIDDYFTKFGYKINRVLEPNITGRTYWNYVEIGSAENIGYGTVPANFMETINNACRKGVTIWHNHTNIGNFALNNTIVT